jgi:ATP-dependent DNA ligase
LREKGEWMKLKCDYLNADQEEYDVIILGARSGKGRASKVMRAVRPASPKAPVARADVVTGWSSVLR